MKKVISYFIKYHVAVNVIIIAFFIFGLVGAKSLKSSFFPLTDSKNILVSIVYPGASPQEVEEGIVLKIEDNLKGLQGVERVTSTSRENWYQVGANGNGEASLPPRGQSGPNPVLRCSGVPAPRFVG